MNSLQFAAMLMMVSSPVPATDLSASTNIGQPGFYGQVDLGDYPRPQLIYPRPVRVERVIVERPPVYFRVPRGNEKNWSKHCREYNACGESVYFVENNWYQREFVPRYQERHGKRQERDEHGDKRRGDNRNDHRQ